MYHLLHLEIPIGVFRLCLKGTTGKVHTVLVEIHSYFVNVTLCVLLMGFVSTYIVFLSYLFNIVYKKVDKRYEYPVIRQS